MGLFTSFQLKSRDADTRRRAALSLGVRGKTGAIASLEPLLADAEWPVRQAAVEAIGVIGDPSGAPLVIAAVAQADESRDDAATAGLRGAAVEALGRIGQGAVTPLVEALGDRRARLREMAIAALGAIGGPEAVAALTATVRDDRSNVRQAGLSALASAAGPAAVPALAQALAHKDPATRRSAAVALGTVGDASATTALRAALSDRERPVREAAADALAAIGSRDAAAALIEAMGTADREFKAALAARLKAMTWTAGDAAERAVQAALHGRFDEAVAEGPAAVDPLVAALGDREAGTRRGAAAALGRVGDARAASALVAAFKDTDSLVREAAVEAIGRIGLAACGPVVDALGDRAGAVRTCAETALAALGPGRVAGTLVERLSAGSAAQHAGQDLRVVTARDALDAARTAADALGRLVDHAARSLPPDVLQRCAAAADVIRVEPGEVPSSSERVDLEPVRAAATAELTRRGGKP